MNHVPPLTLPVRLRIAREHAELGVSEMASVLGVSRNTIARWERGGPHTPPLGMVKQWAAETHVSLGYLLGDEVAETIPAHLERRRNPKTAATRRGGSQVTTHLKAVGGDGETDGVTIENPRQDREAAALFQVAA